MSYTATGLWKRTLGEQDHDPDHEARAKLRAVFGQFHDSVKPLGAEVSQSVPGYTDHSIEHCDSLWDTADLIIGPDFQVTPAEAFVLGGSFLIHDLAMGLAAYSGGLLRIFKSDSWHDLLWADWSEHAEHLQAQALADVANNPTWDGLTSHAVKSSLTTFLREHHAEEAEDLLKKEWELSSGESFYLLSDPEIRHWYGEVIGKVARSHWLDVSELESYLPAPFGAPSIFPSDWAVDPVKIACILRLADAAQIDSRRAHPLHTPFRQPQGYSRSHWEFQEMMLLPYESEGRVVFSSSKSFSPERAEPWWLAYDTVSMIHAELQSVDAYCADQGRPRMRCRSAAGAEAPERFAKYVPTSGWQPLDARPRIRNPIRVIESLGGKALYGDEDDVPIRELLANATDAACARSAAQGPETTVPPTQVKFHREGDDHFVTVRDFGIGMSPEDIAQHLCDFGSSGWRSKRFRDEYPGALASGYSSTGKFGIGFFSVFMIADDVRVVSRSLRAGWDDTYCLEFKEGISHRPVLRRALNAERLHEPGTAVTFHLRRNPLERGGLLHAEAPYTSGQQVEFIRALAFTSRHPIVVCPFESERWEDAVDGQRWFEKSPADIYNASHWDPWRLASSTNRKEAVERFGEMVAPLRDSTGAVIGMICSNAIQLESGALSIAAGYCGGFRSGEVVGVSGVVEGQTIRASRDRIYVPTTIERMQEWLDEQWTRYEMREASTVEESLRFHSFSVGFGVEKSQMPIALTKDGYLTIAELAEWISGRDKFAVVEIGMPRLLEIPGRGSWINNSDDLIQLDRDAVAVLYTMRDFEDGLPEVSFDDPFKDDMDSGDVEGSIDEIATWWWMEHSAPLGVVARTASETWAVELKSLLIASESGTGRLQKDDPYPAHSYAGRSVRLNWRTFYAAPAS